MRSRYTSGQGNSLGNKTMGDRSRNIHFLSTPFDLDSIEHKDGVVSVKYSKDSKIYTVRVCAREKLNDLDIRNSHWAVSDKFGIQVAEAETAHSEEGISLSADRERMSGEMDILQKVIVKADEDIARLENERADIDARLSALKEEGREVDAPRSRDKREGKNSDRV